MYGQRGHARNSPDRIVRLTDVDTFVVLGDANNLDRFVFRYDRPARTCPD